MNIFKILFILIVILLIFPETKNFGQTTLPVSAKNGMVVCSDKNASKVGLEILKGGGNAIDAAIAMSFALAVTYPGAGNIGGGGFILYFRKDGMITSIDFREKAPQGTTSTMYLDEQGNIKNNSNHKGILAVGVPGTVAGLDLAHRKYGKISWEKLLDPAIKLAENGFHISESLAGNFKYFKDEFLKYPSSFKVFIKKDSSTYSGGEIWRQPNLANTLKRIQKSDGKDFYTGKTAELIAEFMRKNGGLITLDDLKKYKAIERKPVHNTYRGYDVYSMGLPSSGGIVLEEMLNILEGYELKDMGHNSVQYLHILTEAMRLAYLDRARYLGDLDFNPDVPLDKLSSKEYAATLRNKIPVGKAAISNIEDVEQLPENPYTTHLSVIDSEGNAVSLTYTIENWYGSKIVVDGAGFLLNNEMGDFNPIPGKTDENGNIGTMPNLIAPRKRMLSSMCPTIVLKDKQPFLIIGTPGGRTIPNTVLQVILNVIDFNMNISESVFQKRIHHQWMPDITFLEEGVLSTDFIQSFEKIGHKTETDPGMNHNEVMGILVDKLRKKIFGESDPRSPDGLAIGY
jgi:gamma-glutamyltranspeptidase / glutathione hydrolase